MSDYDYCKKHDTSFLMPELLMCPKCALERLRAGDVPEPLGDALIEAFDAISKECQDAAIALMAERGRREKAEAQAAAACNVMVAGGIAIEPKVIAECMKERDAARAEVERLKARNAALEPIYEAASALATGQDWNNGTMAKTHGYRQKLIDAVRAAYDAERKSIASDQRADKETSHGK